MHDPINPARYLRCCLMALMLVHGAIAQAAPTASVSIEGRQWASASNGAALPWGEADAYCRGLAVDGHDDWRLPTLDELDTLIDRDRSSIRAPLALDDCCLWSSTSLQERPGDGGEDTGAPASHYFWGIVFDGGIPYYSNRVFADGQALCTRDGG